VTDLSCAFSGSLRTSSPSVDAGNQATVHNAESPLNLSTERLDRHQCIR
jgi:hypothetical protein